MIYYNENDAKAAAWLRELMFEGLIPWGDVDERSIEDVVPRELAGYTQCHFFAGIGGWPYALALAGWPQSRPVWTGSCPCQPFSQAGKGKGTADERHLWPAWLHLVEHNAPAVIFGEQVASPAGLVWLSSVQNDLEVRGFAFGAADLPAASVGAPHIRQRLYWVAESGSQRQQGERLRVRSGGPLEDLLEAGRSSEAGERADARSDERGQGRASEENEHGAQQSAGRCNVIQLADANNPRPQGRSERRDGADQRSPWESSLVSCRDGKRRPVEPGTFPLAHGIPGRVGLLRGYGNAIVPQVAAAFIKASGLI